MTARLIAAIDPAYSKPSWIAYAERSEEDGRYYYVLSAPFREVGEIPMMPERLYLELPGGVYNFQSTHKVYLSIIAITHWWGAHLGDWKDLHLVTAQKWLRAELLRGWGNVKKAEQARRLRVIASEILGERPRNIDQATAICFLRYAIVQEEKRGRNYGNARHNKENE